jgi:hypothetical protein
MWKYHYDSRSALFWDITQRWVVVMYRRFGTTNLCHLQGSTSTDPRRWHRYIVPKHPYRIITQGCIIFQKNADFIYIPAEAWNKKKRFDFCMRNVWNHRLMVYGTHIMSRKQVWVWCNSSNSGSIEAEEKQWLARPRVSVNAWQCVPCLCVYQMRQLH